VFYAVFGFPQSKTITIPAIAAETDAAITSTKIPVKLLYIVVIE
jgi:hypothetical protein